MCSTVAQPRLMSVKAVTVAPGSASGSGPAPNVSYIDCSVGGGGGLEAGLVD